MQRYTFRVSGFLAGLLLTAAACALCSIQACTNASTVTTKSTLRVVPVPPESVWQDLLLVAEASRSMDAAHLFSRRRLRQSIVGGKRVEYPTKRKEYEAALAKLDQELKGREQRVREFGEQVAKALQELQAGRGAFLVDREATGNPNYAYRREDTLMPWGPNVASIVVRYWPEGIGTGEGIVLRIDVVQEYEEWKIDSISPKLPDVARDSRARPAPVARRE